VDEARHDANLALALSNQLALEDAMTGGEHYWSDYTGAVGANHPRFALRLEYVGDADHV
jgi:hypothetical protein